MYFILFFLPNELFKYQFMPSLKFKAWIENENNLKPKFLYVLFTGY